MSSGSLVRDMLDILLLSLDILVFLRLDIFINTFWILPGSSSFPFFAGCDVTLVYFCDIGRLFYHIAPYGVYSLDSPVVTYKLVRG